MSSATRTDRRPPAPVLAVSRLLRLGLIQLVRLYQLTLSPFLGGQCRFLPSCSDYALIALRSKPAWRALGLIAWRLMRCQPLCKGGWDPVKEDPRDVWYRIDPPRRNRQSEQDAPADE